jgi:hypothetical protein
VFAVAKDLVDHLLREFAARVDTGDGFFFQLVEILSEQRDRQQNKAKCFAHFPSLISRSTRGY